LKHYWPSRYQWIQRNTPDTHVYCVKNKWIWCKELPQFDFFREFWLSFAVGMSPNMNNDMGFSQWFEELGIAFQPKGVSQCARCSVCSCWIPNGNFYRSTVCSRCVHSSCSDTLVPCSLSSSSCSSSTSLLPHKCRGHCEEGSPMSMSSPTTPTSPLLLSSSPVSLLPSISPTSPMSPVYLNEATDKPFKRKKRKFDQVIVIDASNDTPMNLMQDQKSFFVSSVQT